MNSESFSEVILWSVLYKAKVGGELHRYSRPYWKPGW